MGVEKVLEAYWKAWHEDDEEACRKHLRECFTDDGVYCDPTAEVLGAAAFAKHLVAARSAFGRFRIERTSGFEQHHGYGRFTWRMESEEGELIVEGFDVVHMAEDGRFTSIIGFFGPFPEA